MATSADPATSIAVSKTFPSFTSRMEQLQKYRTSPVGPQGPPDTSPPTLDTRATELVLFRCVKTVIGSAAGRRRDGNGVPADSGPPEPLLTSPHRCPGSQVGVRSSSA